MDSGCAQHMIRVELKCYMAKFTNLNNENKIHIAIEKYFIATKKNELRGEERRIKLEALIVPGMTANLLSAGKLIKKKINEIKYDKYGATLTGKNFTIT